MTGWHSISEEPPTNKLLIASDGAARWMAIHFPGAPQLKWSGHVATHWFLVPDFPTLTGEALAGDPLRSEQKSARESADNRIGPLSSGGATPPDPVEDLIADVGRMRAKLHAANRPMMRQGLREELRNDCDAAMAKYRKATGRGG